MATDVQEYECVEISSEDSKGEKILGTKLRLAKPQDGRGVSTNPIDLTDSEDTEPDLDGLRNDERDGHNRSPRRDKSGMEPQISSSNKDIFNRARNKKNNLSKANSKGRGISKANTSRSNGKRRVLAESNGISGGTPPKKHTALKEKTRFRAGDRWSRFVFTVNNYSDEEEEAIKGFPCKWLIFEREIAPTTGTKHLQGACIIGKQMARSKISAYPGFRRAYLQVMRGSPSQNKEYCSKEGDYFEKGEQPLAPGKNTKLHGVVKRLYAGESLKDIVKNEVDGGEVYVKYHKGLTALSTFRLDQRPITQPPIVVWIHGPTGRGKTRIAIETAISLYGPDGFWLSNGDLKWFDGYIGQPVAIFDDFRPQACKFYYLLRLLDRYPLRVEVKGGFFEFIPRLIIVTTPKTPTETYHLSKGTENLRQLERRIHIVLEMSGDTFNSADLLSRLRIQGDALVVVPLQTTSSGQDDVGRTESSPRQDVLSSLDAGIGAASPEGSSGAMVQTYRCTGDTPPRSRSTDRMSTSEKENEVSGDSQPSQGWQSLWTQNEFQLADDMQLLPDSQ